jgi:hypothetical protein
MRKSNLLLYLMVFLLVMGMGSSPPPTPHGVSGTIYSSDGVTPVPLGTGYRLLNLNSSASIYGVTSIPIPGMSGDYFETVDAVDGDIIVVIAWNATHYGRKSYLLIGDKEYANVNLNTTRPPEVRVRIAFPVNDSRMGINQTFNVTANITAVGGSDSYGCNATVMFSNDYAVRLSSGQTSRHVLGSILFGTSLVTVWKVIASRGWSVNISASALCSSDRERFENHNNDTVYNITVDDSAAPIVLLASPLNRSFSRASPAIFMFNVTDHSGVSNCSLYVDGLLNRTNRSVVAGRNFNFSLFLADGNHSWRVSCFDNSSRHNFGTSLVYKVRIDTVAPAITIVSPDDRVSLANNTVFFYYRVDDVNDLAGCLLIVNSSVLDSDWTVIKSALHNFSVSLAHGSYSWQINCSDLAGNMANSTLRYFNVTDPDFKVVNSGIRLSNCVPTENELVSINASIMNIGDENASGVVVSFCESLASQCFSNITINLPAKSTVFAMASWIARPGKHTIYVVVDPPLATNGSFRELDEANNYANVSVYTKIWQTYFGSLIGQLMLDTESEKSIVQWLNISSFFGNILVTDSDSSISWSSLQAIGQTAGNISDLDDFAQIDTALNISYYNDTVNITFAKFGFLKTESFVVFDRVIRNVPIINSTNTSAFVTGILWDYGDLARPDYNGSQDLVFIARVNRAAGAFGTYDYEIRVPANLRKYRNPNNLDTVTFFTEIT